jgi:pantoate--beta-alanine ligase
MQMEIINTVKDMQSLSRERRSEGKTIGLVPTMGALHEGHLSLVKRAEKDNDVSVVSIFVNPAHSNIETGDTGRKLCGASRPGHFNGVATVVSKLFHSVLPDRAYFGQKDFQQTVIIRKLAGQIDIIVCPTVREHDGLAMSSRNSYLNPEERKASTVLFRTLQHAQGVIEKGVHDAVLIKNEMDSLLKKEPLANMEYIEIVDTKNLVSMETVKKPAAICLAVRIGKIRLIDNVVVE